MVADRAEAEGAVRTIASLFGTDLAYSTGAVSQTDVGAGAMPTVLAGVRVFVSGMPASLYYVSSKQINFLIPSDLRAGDVPVFVAREGTHGPILTLTLTDASPGLFQVDANSDQDWSMVIRDTCRYLEIAGGIFKPLLAVPQINIVETDN